MLSPSLNKEAFLFSKIRGLSFAFRWRIQERGPGGPSPPPPYFWTKVRPEGPKSFFFFQDRAPPAPSPLSEGLDPPLDTIYKTKQHRYLCTGPERATNFPLEYTLSDQYTIFLS